MRSKWETLQFAIMEHKVAPGAILVFARLLDHCNLTTLACYPSKATLAKKVGCSARQVHNHLRELEEAGFIQTFSRSGFRSNTYHIPILTGNMRSPTAEEKCRRTRKKAAAKPLRNFVTETGDAPSNASSISVRPPKDPNDDRTTVKKVQAFENKLVGMLGDKGDGWERMMALAPEISEAPLKLLIDGTISVTKAVKLTLLNIKKAEAGEG